METLRELFNRELKPFNINDMGGLKEDEYLKDNVIYCKECNTRRSREGIFSYVRIYCDCQQAEYDKEQERIKEVERQKELLKLKQASLMGERYKDVNFNTTETGHNPTFDTAYIRCKKYCEAYNKVIERGLGIYLWGDKGCGKTHITACMANDLMEKRKQVLFTNFFEISKMLRGTFNNQTKMSEADYIRKLATIDFLFIDDLGTERVQNKDGDMWLQEKIFDILNKRYNMKKPTIFTSNYSLQELVTDRGLMDKTVDRIAEMSSAILKFEGESYRMKARVEKELPF